MQGLSITSSIAASIGIAGSSWLAGNISSLSTISIPSLLDTPSVSPHILALQWRNVFTRGKSSMPPGAIIIALSYGYLSYNQRSGGIHSWKRYLVAGMLTLCIVPFTIFMMSSTNEALLKIAEGEVGEGRKGITMETTRELLERWRGLNLIRSVFPLFGTGVALWTLLG
ncbi:uncharacterized protein BCR38DRAFT_446456 [Pseudomassariella vexata]|uniref:DUF1772-domain-containing protein n=1 Tax=Pseudomassariella vexata TaxID=1141098 RepID=A0A1Y2DHM0_9PEZI|nr:uncharacterized protein BCR38DRAFT_446456 [Pseudomassariella vexata]ORY58743.1 hypothetical protein BCR38DRAFT_446456 [Pseudomassariella vexata]